MVQIRIRRVIRKQNERKRTELVNKEREGLEEEEIYLVSNEESDCVCESVLQ